MVAPGLWIVQVSGLTGTADQQIAAFEPTVDALGLNVHIQQQLGIDGMFLLSGPSSLDVQTLSSAMATVPNVQFVEPDFEQAAAQVIPNDPSFNQLWGMNNTGSNPGVAPGTPGADISAPAAWDLTGPNHGSTQVVVAIDDSGVDYTHPDLYKNIWINQTEIPTSIRSTLVDTDGDGLITFWDLNDPANAGKVADNNHNGYIDAGDILRPISQGGWEDGIDGNGTPGSANGFVDDIIGWDFYNNDNDPNDEWTGVWHGTHVAGTIGAIGNNGVGVTGVNWKTQLMIVRGLGPQGSGPYSALIGALDYAVANGAKLSNNSWGGSTPSSALQDAVVNAQQHGHLMVVAAGNGGSDGVGDNLDNPASETSYPAVYPYDNIITVANTTNTDTLNPSSNYGLVSVDLGAPGTNIFSTMSSTAGPSYGYLTGTSMATPHVTGTAALMWSLNPSASYTEIRNTILSTVDPISALSVNGPTPVASGGRLDAARAVAAFGFAVADTDPAVGSVTSTPPTSFTVDFTQPYDPTSVQASDFTVNGIPADSVSFTDSATLTFSFATSPVTAQGLQTMAVAPGAISALSTGNAIFEFTGTFRYDAVPLAVVSISPTPGTIIPAPFTFLDVTFNEAVDPTSIQAADLVLSRGTVVAAAVLAGTNNRTVRFSLSGLTTSGPLTATVGAGAITDAFGNPGPSAPVQIPFVLNTTGSVFPVPLNPLPPLGSLVYTGSTTGAIAAPGELDPYTLSVDAGQSITVTVSPPASGGAFGDSGGSADDGSGLVSTLQPTIELRDPSGNVIATAIAPVAGKPAVLQVGAAATTGTYTITVGAVAGADAYTMSVYLNAEVEAEAFGGASDNTRGTAQDLGPAFLPLAPGSDADRAAVRGQLVNAPSSATNLITNGNFETGNFNGWTVSTQGLNGWQINNGTVDPASPATPLPAISGGFDALSNTTAPGTRFLFQNFTVPTVVAQATLSWSDRIQNFASAFAHPGQEFRVLITDTAGNVLQTVFSTNPGDSLSQVGPNNRSFDITALLQAHLGQTLRLRFEEQDSLNYMNVNLDNISLTVNSTLPVPADDFYALNLTAGKPVSLDLGLTNFSPVTSFAPTRTDFTTPPTATYPLFVGYRDLNGDGKLDMVESLNVLGSNAGEIAVRLGNGDGTFGTPTILSTGSTSTRFLDFGDVNGDGKLDIVATNDPSGIVSLFLGHGDGTFAPAVTTQVAPSALGVTVRDINGDGRADAVVAHFGGTISVLLGQANGTFSAPTSFSTGAPGSFTTALGDLNGDGKLDVVTGNFSNGNISVLLGNGDGTFGAPTVYAMAPNTWGVALADLNGDGKLDVVSGNQGAGNIAVRLGNGDGTFGAASFFSTGGNGPRTVVLADVNNDGKLDAVVPNIGSATVSVIPGNGDGTFGAPLVFATNANPNAATVADVNGDGLPDLSTADAGPGNGGSVSLRLNTTQAIRLELQDAAGNVVASAVRGATNFDQGLTFTPTTSGTYYAHVFGNATTATYTLVAVRDAAFDTEPNDLAASAQVITGTAGALGNITAGQSGGTVVPGADTNVDGNFNNSFPFNIGGFGIPSMRYQQIYSASLFSSPGVIDAIRFRQDPGFSGTFTASFDMKITLSYAAQTVNNASAVFADNIGNGAVTVFDGVMTISSTVSPANPRPFDIVLNVAPLFHYDPSQGDLLVDISMRNSPNIGVAFDAVSGVAGITRIYQTDVNATTGQGPFSSGLVTEFDMVQSSDDWYAVDLAAGQRVQFATTTPAGGPGEFANTLDPHIELYDPNGNKVASGTPLLDNRNESITFTAPTAGRYRVRVTGDNGTTGEYFLAVNNAPVAANDSAITNEDTPVDIPVLANDTDDTPLSQATVNIVTGPSHGSVSVSSTGVVTYTPGANYSGPDSFTYTVTDAGGAVSTPATVTLTVIAVADTPALSVTPTASGDENAPIALHISAALTDTDGSEVLAVLVAGVPQGGTLSAGTDNGGGVWALTPDQLAGLTITLPDNLPGDAPFTLTVTATSTEQSNGSNASITATIDVTVKNVAPTATFLVPAGGVEGSPVTVSLTNATDVSPVDQAAGFTYAFDFGAGYGAFSGSNTASFTPLDNGTYTVKAKVQDKDGGVTEYTTTVVVINAPPVADAGGNQTVNEGDTVTLNGSFTDPGVLDTHTFLWHVDASNGQVIADGTGTSFTFVPNDDGTYTVTFTVTDNDGGVGTDTAIVTVNNVAPQNVTITGPTSGFEGSPLSFAGNFTDPGSADTHTLAWHVDASNGQVIADGTGSNFSFVPNDDGTYTVTFTVTDDDGGVGTATTTVTVNNVAPQNVTITGPSAGVRGQVLAYTGSFFDPGSADTHTQTWTVTLNGSVVASGSGASFSFVPTDSGTYQVSFTVTDDDGGTTTSSTAVTVSAMAIQPDPLNPGKGLLVIGGTTANDVITVTPGLGGSYVVTILTTTPQGVDLTVGVFRPVSNGWELDLTIGGSTITLFSTSLTLPLDGIVVNAQAGDDDVTIAGGINLTSFLYGGDGNDRLKGGGGSNVILGGAGDDLLVGGNGRDILIGGMGADRIVGNADDDILISGFTAFDNDRAALAALLGVWVDPTLTYAQRIASLQDPTLRGGVYLGSATVGDDSAADVLTGGSGLDWFWFDAAHDRVTDLHDEAFRNDLDFMGL
jgi:subtilisin family serine protease